MTILLTILTFVLVLVALFLILVILMQKAQADAGMGAVMGGGMTEATFGAETSNVLSKATINATIIFFVLSLGLYLGWVYKLSHGTRGGAALPSIPAAPAAPHNTAPLTLPPIAPAPVGAPAAAPKTAPATTSPAPAAKQ